MGASLSQPFEPVKVAAPPEASSSAKPPPLAAPGAPSSPEQAPIFNNCWSCRVLSGSGLIGAGGYVYWVARKPMKLGYPPSPGTITQMVIGINPGEALSEGAQPWFKKLDFSSDRRHGFKTFILGVPLGCDRLCCAVHDCNGIACWGVVILSDPKGKAFRAA